MLFPDALKTPYKNGTTHVHFELLDFIARLAALVPKPRVHLTRFHGVFAPNSKHRVLVTGEAKAKLSKSTEIDAPLDSTARCRKMSWAMRLKRVFGIDISVCRHCHGAVRVIACIEDLKVIKQILAHINQPREPWVRIVGGVGIRAPPTPGMSPPR